ncbi:MAG: hypothetical protein K0Q73_6565 [Paenibacillus sp.]|jgi:hypothetical protein|nr:hypothetical protein [Paenibacillus sp.]
MKPPVFHDSENEAFYLLAERRCTDSYHRALFFTLVVEGYPRPHSRTVRLFRCLHQVGKVVRFLANRRFQPHL